MYFSCDSVSDILNFSDLVYFRYLEGIAFAILKPYSSNRRSVGADSTVLCTTRKNWVEHGHVTHEFCSCAQDDSVLRVDWFQFGTFPSEHALKRSFCAARPRVRWAFKSRILRAFRSGIVWAFRSRVLWRCPNYRLSSIYPMKISEHGF